MSLDEFEKLGNLGKNIKVEKQSLKSDELIKKEMQQTLLNIFLITVVGDWISKQSKPIEVINNIFTSWKKSLKIAIEPFIQQQTEFSHSELGKLIGLMSGEQKADGEKARLDFNRNLKEVENMLRPVFEQFARGDK